MVPPTDRQCGSPTWLLCTFVTAGPPRFTRGATVRYIPIALEPVRWRWGHRGRPYGLRMMTPLSRHRLNNRVPARSCSARRAPPVAPRRPPSAARICLIRAQEDTMATTGTACVLPTPPESRALPQQRRPLRLYTKADRTTTPCCARSRVPPPANRTHRPREVQARDQRDSGTNHVRREDHEGSRTGATGTSRGRRRTHCAQSGHHSAGLARSERR